MRPTILLACFATVLLAGCQTTGHSPYEYRFDNTRNSKVCLLTEPASAEGLSLQVQSVLEEKGFKVKAVDDLDNADCKLCVRFTAKMGDWVGSRIQSATMEYTREGKGIRYSVTAKTGVGTSPTFGAPIDDEIILIRSLVDQVFPNPIPWED
mgnify:CR=1 FL=1